MNMLKGAFTLLLMGVLTLAPSKVLSQKKKGVDTMAYLEKFGYFDDQPKGNRSENAKKNALKKFQTFANIPVTGEVDNATIAVMEEPRCGMKDTRYTLGPKWLKNPVTYRFDSGKYTPDLPQADVDRIIRAAFDAWQAVSSINIVLETNPSKIADIRLLFGATNHGDAYPFDGPYGVLAHAFYPSGGDAHFDEDETWTDKTSSGINLFQVAVHEFGHSLGLGHSSVAGAIMYPYYQGYVQNFSLHSDDIYGIRALYGTRAITVESLLSRCPDIPIEAIVRMSDGKTYIFKGTEYYRLTDNGIEDGYPRAISEDFPGLPDYVDAALTHAGSTYFFKGQKFWKVTNRQVGRKEDIAGTFPGIPDSLDAATEGSDGKLYFMKGTNYYIYKDGLQQSGTIDEWSGIPAFLNAAMQDTTGSIYFFKNEYLYRFDENTQALAQDDPPYPRLTSVWLGC